MADLELYAWISMLLRWLHVVVAMAWIGASFYLISWENKFNRLKDLRPGVEGDFWTIQGGDFYFVEKLKTAPAKLPDELHWFKYESYLTWLSGFALMGVFYYTDATIMLLDQRSPLNTSGQAAGVSVLSLVVVWLLYALYCRTPWARKLGLSAIIGLASVAMLAVIYGYLFNGRAAIIHVGAAMGTIMSANVFFSIIPWHKQLVRAIEDQAPLEALYNSHPGFRSRHNHYMTLPVLFLMLSVHAPINFDGSLSWLVITLLVAALGFLKHFHTCIQKRKASVRHLLLGLLLLGVAVSISSLDAQPDNHCDGDIPITELETMVSNRCLSCHVARGGAETADQFLSKPGRDIKGDLLAFRKQVLELAVARHTMPPSNVTGMTGPERKMLACWFENEGRED
jgi:uncharacterized membrane protein